MARRIAPVLLWLGAAASGFVTPATARTAQSDPAGAAFLKFLETLGADTAGADIAVFPHSGRGVRATKATKKGDPVASIPMAAVIHIGVVLQDPEVGKDLAPLLTDPKITRELGHTPLEKNVERLSKEAGVALWLAYQRRKGRKSFAHPWIGLLTEVETMSDPLRFADDAATLQASPLRSHIHEVNANLTRHLALLKQHATSDWAQSVTLAEYRWGSTNVLRRSFMMQHKDPNAGWIDV